MIREEKRDYDRKYHANRNPEAKKRKQELQNIRLKNLLKDWRAYKKERGCACCEENEPVVLELHHLDPSQKDHSLANMVRLGFGWEKIMNEASKGVVVCSNCHKKIHAGLIEI